MKISFYLEMFSFLFIYPVARWANPATVPGMRAAGSVYEGLKPYINLLEVLESCKVSRWKVCGSSVQCLIAAPSNLNLWNQLEILGSFKSYSLNPELRFLLKKWSLTILELSRLSVGIWVLSRILQGQKLYINLLKILEGCKVSRWKACGWFVYCCIAALLNLNVTRIKINRNH